MIRLFYDNTVFRLRGSRKALQLIEKVIREENRISGDLNFIVTNKFRVKEINIEFLKHDYFTDVIAFGYSDGNIIDGDVFMSIETIKENAVNYKVSLKNEMIRVMIHGTLHLCGYEDKKEAEKLVMREKENYWISIFDKKG
ncbi:MAG: putative rRNA maturation factor [Bacteroidota bacterium]|nr:putative rRNA maturation factor [Bacteroidota bacterium]